MNIAITEIEGETVVSLVGIETAEEYAKNLFDGEVLVGFLHLNYDDIKMPEETKDGFNALEALVVLEPIREALELVLSRVYKLNR